MTTPTGIASRRTAWSQIWTHRFYRASVLSLFVSGLGVSASTPQLSLYFVTELGASLPVAGLFYLTNLAAPVAGFLIGRLSDRRRDRLTTFRICSLAGALGWLAMALATRVWMPFVISVVVLSLAGATGAQLFAAVRDELTRNDTVGRNRIVSTIRMAYTAGFIIGPVLGSWAGSVIGLRHLLLACAACVVLQTVPLITARVPRLVVAGAGDVVRRVRLRPLLPLLAFTGLCVCALCGDTLKIAFLPVYMETVLKVSPVVRGAVIATQPLIELMLMPVAGWAADRFGGQRVVIIGAAFGVAANAGYGLSDGVGGLFVSQVLMAGLWSTIAALGITVAQDLYPQGVGVASSVFYSGLMLAVALGGVIGGFGVSIVGMPNVFFLPAVVCGLATIGMILMAMRRPPAVSPAQ